MGAARTKSAGRRGGFGWLFRETPEPHCVIAAGEKTWRNNSPIFEGAVGAIGPGWRDKHHRALIVFRGFEQTNRLLRRHLDLFHLLSRLIRLLLVLLVLVARLRL